MQRHCWPSLGAENESFVRRESPRAEPAGTVPLVLTGKTVLSVNSSSSSGSHELVRKAEIAGEWKQQQQQPQQQQQQQQQQAHDEQQQQQHDEEEQQRQQQQVAISRHRAVVTPPLNLVSEPPAARPLGLEAASCAQRLTEPKPPRALPAPERVIALEAVRAHEDVHDATALRLHGTPRPGFQQLPRHHPRGSLPGPGYLTSDLLEDESGLSLMERLHRHQFRRSPTLDKDKDHWKFGLKSEQALERHHPPDIPGRPSAQSLAEALMAATGKRQSPGADPGNTIVMPLYQALPNPVPFTQSLPPWQSGSYAPARQSYKP